MLSLFKLPFWSNREDCSDKFPARNIASAIFRNYNYRKEESSDVKKRKVVDIVNTEFDSLETALTNKEKADRYELIRSALLNIEKQVFEKE